MKVRASLGKLRGPVGSLDDPLVDLRFRWGSCVFGDEGPRAGGRPSFSVVKVHGRVGKVPGAVNGAFVRVNGRLLDTESTSLICTTGRLLDTLNRAPP